MASENEEELFIVGGIDQNNERKRLESLNLTTMDWTRLADMNANRSSLACARLGDGLLVSGGWGNLDNEDDTAPLAPVRTVEFYDPASGINYKSSHSIRVYIPYTWYSKSES